MKIINLITKNIFDLPKSEAEELLQKSSDVFAKITKNKKILKLKHSNLNDDSVLKHILDE